MWFSSSTVLAGLANLGLVLAATTSTTTSNDIPSSTNAASYLSAVWSGQGPTPTWATGKYATTLASSLYSVETSFVGRSDYQTIVDAIWSAASKGGDSVLASVSSSQWDWGAITTADWYTSNVAQALQTEVANYDKAWDSVITSVQAKATATGNGAAAKCTGMALAGVAAGVAAVAGMM